MDTQTVIVFGGHAVAESVDRLVTAMGWRAVRATDPSELPGLLARADALVVLEHDLSLAGPALAAALASDVGYIGAMGNRETQTGRREWLLSAGVDESALARIHGPAGLDIGADTPAEIALAILAEIVAQHRGFTGVARVAERSGPIHPDAPPSE